MSIHFTFRILIDVDFFAEISIYNVKGLLTIFKPLHCIEEKLFIMQSKWKHDVHPFLVAFLLALFDHVDGVPSLVLLWFVICCWIYCHKAFIFCHYSWFVDGFSKNIHIASLFVICCWIVIKHTTFVIIRDLLLDSHKTFIFFHYPWFVVGWVRKHSICPDKIGHGVVEEKKTLFLETRQRPIFELQKIQMSIVSN